MHSIFDCKINEQVNDTSAIHLLLYYDFTLLDKKKMSVAR